ncbi:hypothetical protein Purlil1_2224 [Purpureocillium lilacinum]|uniref:Major facilitator superfamily (MFS) profile domain-containing protein n=1 Tax=Purpureocillium lilacinum TaxID=33203 RepID=A0ABR0C9K7_PURLI|nr:hypothetical protein Purlil1_2224 [Purpureocillium lilacinum]
MCRWGCTWAPNVLDHGPRFRLRVRSGTVSVVLRARAKADRTGRSETLSRRPSGGPRFVVTYGTNVGSGACHFPVGDCLSGHFRAGSSLKTSVPRPSGRIGSVLGDRPPAVPSRGGAVGTYVGTFGGGRQADGSAWRDVVDGQAVAENTSPDRSGDGLCGRLGQWPGQRPCAAAAGPQAGALAAVQLVAKLGGREPPDGRRAGQRHDEASDDPLAPLLRTRSSGRRYMSNVLGILTASSGRSTPVPENAPPSTKSLSSARKQVRAEQRRRIFPTIEFASRVSHFDPESDYRDFHGFFNLFWIGLAIMGITTMLRNFKDTGYPLRIQIWSLFTVKLWHLAIADFLMVAGTAVSLPLHRWTRARAPDSAWTWKNGGMAVQSVYQVAWLALWIVIPFWLEWTWTAQVFLLLHTMVLLMKMHSYAFYNGHLSETEKRLRALDNPSSEADRGPAYQYPAAVLRKGSISGIPTSMNPTAAGKPTLGEQTPPEEDDTQSADELETLREDLARELTSPMGNVTYPRNLTWSNYFDYLLCPTLCYELEYPRTKSINWTSLNAKIVATFGCIFLLTITSEEFIVPVLADASRRLEEVAVTSGSVSESMLILAESISWLLFPFMLTFLLVFLVIFEYVLGAFAEITHFADRHFYADWWNSTDWMEFSREWNVPVYSFLRRHVYSASRPHTGKAGAMVITFLISAVGHEIVMACITKKIRGYGFVCQMLQLPIVMLQRTKWHDHGAEPDMCALGDRLLRIDDTASLGGRRKSVPRRFGVPTRAASPWSGQSHGGSRLRQVIAPCLYANRRQPRPGMRSFAGSQMSVNEGRAWGQIPASDADAAWGTANPGAYGPMKDTKVLTAAVVGAHHAWPDDTAALAGGGEPGCCGEKAADARVRVRICLAACIHAADRGVETLHIIAVVNGVRMESASPPSRYGKIRCRRASSMNHHGRSTARVDWTTGLLQAIQHCRRHTRQRWTVDELLTSRRVTHRSQRARLAVKQLPCREAPERRSIGLQPHLGTWSGREMSDLALQKQSTLQSVHAMQPSDMDKRDAQVLEAEDGTKVAVAKADYSGAREKTDPKEIALVRKLDRWIMLGKGIRVVPMLWSMYWLNYLDRNAIALARLNDLEEDLNLTGTQYQTCVSILFVGYILGQVPSNMFLTRTRPSRYMVSPHRTTHPFVFILVGLFPLSAGASQADETGPLQGIMMMLWAIVSGLTAVSRNFVGLLLTRFFLGVTEAPYYPGAVYLLSVFYTRKEVATRIAVLYTGNILATAFAGLIAAGIYHGLDDVAGVAGWRWLFILQGAVTFVVAVVGFFLLPDFPRTTWWLTQEERDLAYSRMELDTAGNEGETGAVKGLKQAVKDPVVWVFAFMAHMHLAANGFKNFFPSVVETLNFNTTVTLVLTCPPYLIAGAVTILVSWSSGRFNERTWHITASKAVAVVGFVAAAAAAPGDVAGRYAAMVIFTIGTYGVNSLILGWCGSVCAQTKEKKAAAIGLVTTLMNCSFVWTPYLWPKSGAPRYVLAMASSAAFSIATAALAWLAKGIMLRRNRKLRESEDVSVFYVY